MKRFNRCFTHAQKLTAKIYNAMARMINPSLYRDIFPVILKIANVIQCDIFWRETFRPKVSLAQKYRIVPASSPWFSVDAFRA